MFCPLMYPASSEARKATNAATSMLARDLELNTVYHLTCRMLLGNNSSTLWLQPNAETDPGATSTDEATPKTAAAFALSVLFVALGIVGNLPGGILYALGRSSPTVGPNSH